MKTRLIILFALTLIASSVNGQIRFIKGRLLNKDLLLTGLYLRIDTFDIEFYDINDSIDFSHVSSDGRFDFNCIPNNYKSVIFNFGQCVKLKIINIPLQLDTIDLGNIDLIKHKEISTKDYNDLKQSMIQTNQRSLLKQDYESYLSKIYIPQRDGICGYLYGYKCSDELERYQMSNPWIEESKIKVDFDSDKDLIIIDYNKIKK